MYLGPWDQGGPWNSRGIAGMERFIRRAFGLVTETGAGPFDQPLPAVGDRTVAPAAREDDPARDDRPGRVPVQHHGRRLDRVRERADEAAGDRADPHPGVARGAGDARAADGAQHPLRRRGAVGAPGDALLGPPPVVAGRTTRR